MVASDPLAELLGYQIRRLSVTVMADLSATLETLGLRPPEATVLLAIAGRKGMTQSEIGRVLGIKRANMAPLIGGLEARGLLSRSAVDGRSQALSLTADGEALHHAAVAATRAHEQRMFGSLSDAERARLAQQLRDLWQGRDG